jgi:RNA recognition motif-containing protein
MPVRLFVGNLSYEATEAELREHFGTIGPVTYCYLPTDRETGRPRGFAFVEFGDDSHAHQAIDRLNNQLFRGRPLAVKEAQPRESRPAGAGPRSFGPPGGGGGAPRPYSPGPGGPPRSYSGPPRDSGFGGPASPASASRERNFGPDAPPKGKRKPTFNRKDQQGPKGPIRTKTNNRIFSAFGDDEEDPGAAAGEFDDFATSLGPDAPDEE